ncbi:MAG: MotA/TolQ/ExbB proton channel family protein [Chitinophagales bacterium]
MANYFELIPYILLAAWLVFSIYYLIRAVRHPEGINPYIFESIPQVFPTIGILGTFMGIAYGLWHFNENDIEGSIPRLIQGLKTAFGASIFGVGLLIIFSKFTAIVQRKNDKGKLSDETIALNKLIELVTQMSVNLNESFIYVDANGNMVKPANYFRDIFEESKKQSQALQSFSTDLSIKIEAGFDTIMSTQIQKGVIPELQAVKAEIENLGKKLQDPTTEMTQNVVKSLQDSLGIMIDEFKTSMSGSTKSELENLTSLLNQAGGSLLNFPARLEGMTENLNHNFKELQLVVQQISKQMLSQSEQSTEQMRKQVEGMSEILKTKVGDLQVGQEVLMNKQTDNLKVSDKLLTAFNTSIEKMNRLSVDITETISKFNKVQNDLNFASGQLKVISENVNSSTNSFKDAQQRFSQQSNQFLEKNGETIAEIQMALVRAKEVSADYAQKFTVIDKGLQGIFAQIQSGLNDYRDTVGASLESYLGKYTEALTKTAESLAGATSKHEDILEELTEQLSKLNLRRN